MRTILMTAALLGMLTLGLGCRAGVRVRGPGAAFVNAAVMTAAIVGTAAIIASHDAHFHDEVCGCARRYHDGRYVYYYNGWWEYYDDETGTWYHY